MFKPHCIKQLPLYVIIEYLLLDDFQLYTQTAEKDWLLLRPVFPQKINLPLI